MSVERSFETARIRIPAAGWRSIRNALVDAANERSAACLNLALWLYGRLKAEDERSGASLVQCAMQELASKGALHPAQVERVLNLVLPDGVLRRPLRSDATPLSRSKTCELEVSDTAAFALNAVRSEVIWAARGTPAELEAMRQLPEVDAFFKWLAKSAWTVGSGGEMRRDGVLVASWSSHQHRMATYA